MGFVGVLRGSFQGLCRACGLGLEVQDLRWFRETALDPDPCSLFPLVSRSKEKSHEGKYSARGPVPNSTSNSPIMQLPVCKLSGPYQSQESHSWTSRCPGFMFKP